MSVDLTTISRSLTRAESGVWKDRGSGEGELTFPEDAHDACFELEDRSFWFAHRNECISLALGHHAFDGLFLDVGGGNGAVSHRLAADGIETVVLEPGGAGAANARKRGLPNVVCATLEQAAFAPESFGAAGLFDVIEHVDDDAAMLSRVRAVLRPGGVLAVTVPAYDWLWSAEDEMAGHYRRYTLRRLRQKLERAGFDLRYETYFFAALTAPLFLLRSLRYRLLDRSPSNVGSVAAEQHVPRAPLRRMMNLLLSAETRTIGRGRTIPFGTSCLAIAVAAK